ncbi:MAG TPA: secretin N-terminal domain-containing protein [Burkholderiales bacterium]|nr:secretin N-terminal domain-containing protein [Burkholderiales bacterium]
MRRISLACCVLLLGACAHAPIPQSGTHLRAEAPAPSGTVPAPIQISTILPKPTPTSRPETYSVVVNGVKAQELLFALARDARLNIDVHPGITGTVTINAIEQTLPQLLTRISKQVDMRWELDGPNLIVMPDSPYLHTYRIDYVNMERNAIGTVGVSSQIGTGGGTAGAGGGAAGAGGGNSSSTTVRNTSDNKFWVTLEKNIKDILHETDKILPTGAPQPTLVQALTGAPGTAPPAVTTPNVSFREAAAVIVNAEASLVIVRATSRQHEKIQEFLDQVMANVRRQVLIEATIAEVQLNNQYQQGIDWSALRTRGLTTVSGSQIASGNVTVNPSFPPGVLGTAPGNLPSAPSVGFPNLLTLAVSRGTNIAGVLQLLESFGNVRVLSSPKLSVLNNQTALLRVVDNIVYFNVQVSIAAGNLNTNAVTATNTTPVTVPVGFVMNVTPQISDNDTILLNVKPTTTRLIKFVNDPNPDLAKAGVLNQVPQLRMREMESLIKVNSGQIAVLGGLIEDSVNDIEDTIPIINSIPIIGSLFSSRNRNNTKTELVVFLRPVVVKDASIDGDFRSFRTMIPGEDFISRPNPGKAGLPEFSR